VFQRVYTAALLHSGTYGGYAPMETGTTCIIMPVSVYYVAAQAYKTKRHITFQPSTPRTQTNASNKSRHL